MVKCFVDMGPARSLPCRMLGRGTWSAASIARGDCKSVKNNRMWNRNFILVFLCNVFIAFSFHILTPTLPKYVVALGGGVETAGLVATAFTVTAVITRPFVGYYIDMKSRKKILLASVVIIAAAILGYMFSASVAAMMAFRLLHGIGWGMATTATSTVLVASIPEEQIGRGIGLYGICSSLASVFAPNLGLQLSGSLGYFRMFLVAFALAAASCVLGLLIDESSLRVSPKKPAQEFGLVNRLFAREAAAPAMITLCVGAGMAVISNYLFYYVSPFMGGEISGHCQELPFVFRNSQYLGVLAGGEGREELQNAVSGAWTAFAKHGVPDCDDIPHWERFHGDKMECMVFSKKIRMEQDFDSDLTALVKQYAKLPPFLVRTKG